MTTYDRKLQLNLSVQRFPGCLLRFGVHPRSDVDYSHHTHQYHYTTLRNYVAQCHIVFHDYFKGPSLDEKTLTLNTATLKKLQKQKKTSNNKYINDITIEI